MVYQAWFTLNRDARCFVDSSVYFFPSLFSIFENNQIYQWFIGVVYMAVFWFIIYIDMSARGLDDCKKVFITCIMDL